MFDKDKFLKEGKIAEANFAESLIQAKGGRIKSATLQQDRYLHIDLIWINNDNDITFDVKGIKRHSRSGELDDSMHWIELKNVNGKPGWLFGEAIYIAFETQNEWLVVDRNKLKAFIKVLIDTMNPNIVKDTSKFYGLYQREGRQDLIMKLPTKMLDIISTFKITK